MSNHKESSSIAYWIIGLITVAVFAVIMILSFRNSNPISSKTNRQLALNCTTDMATQFHIHPILKIIINNQPQEIPANIGVAAGCMNALHTHDKSGKIHVEAPEKRDFNLSDFFAIWEKTFTHDQILDYKVDEKHIIKVTVNGNEVDTFERTLMHDLDEIIISYQEKK